LFVCWPLIVKGSTSFVGGAADGIVQCAVWGKSFPR